MVLDLVVALFAFCLSLGVLVALVVRVWMRRETGVPVEHLQTYLDHRMRGSR